jgi:RNA polymerase sigma-70 factor (ECF subfamily)
MPAANHRESTHGTASPSANSDALQWHRILGENGHLFERLREQHLSLVHRELHRCHDWIGHEDTQELEQAIWVAAWEALPRFRGEAVLSTWLTAISRRVIGSWLRQARTRQTALAQFASDKQINGEPGQAAETVRRLTIQEALEQLIPAERQLIRLRYFDSLSDRQISQLAGLPLGTVKGRIRAGLKHLRALV